MRDRGEIYSVLLDGSGGATAAPPDLPVPAGPAVHWLHLPRNQPDTLHLLTNCGVDSYVIDALLADETRPRCTVHDRGVLLNLRGVNLSPGAEPEDMISVRFWIEAHRVIGVWRRPLQAVEDVIAGIGRGSAPRTPGDLISRIALRLADRAEPSVTTLNESIDALEEELLTPGADVSAQSLSATRRSAIILRRYMLPQRDALSTLEIEDLDWLGERDRAHLREAAERITRLGEDLETIRDRAQVIHEQVMEHRSERMNRQMLVLSVVAAVFLPLGLLTGLLGINVGGIPLADKPYGFVTVCGVLLAVAAGLVWFFRRIGMFR
ncbi:zinc transporter ZntB [Oceanibium sediminis]|uniref:zinc transporter ZntB n=1 Tax=Oceanibium sediminis TaxID=2026339 RepID=UPI000DD3613F|nr:zinc transporter ZntB [Oceanibium sediminis]